MKFMYSKTKKIILLAVIMAALQLLIFSGTSFSEIAGSLHDLSSGGLGLFRATNQDQICIFCHTPHNAISQDPNDSSISLPLWNRSISGLTGFSLYASATFNASLLGGEDTQTQPRGMSLLCLSCHDGVSALNVLQNYGSVGPITMEGDDQLGDVYNPTGLEYPGANIGGAYPDGGENIRDLSDDHPVSFVYDANLRDADAANGVFGLKDPTTIAPLRLFNNRLECATCHNPHEEGDEVIGNFPFLRMSNLNSEMCIKCHNK